MFRRWIVNGISAWQNMELVENDRNKGLVAI